MSVPRALIVEDEPLFQAEITRLLRQMFGAVDIADDISCAWSHLNAYDYELVTIDLSLVAGVKVKSVLPNERGFELLARIRQSERGAPTVIVIVTGYPTTERVRNAFAEYEVDDFIEKPFTGDAFLARIRRVLVKGRIRASQRLLDQRHTVTLTASTTRLVSAAMSGPSVTSYALTQPRERIDFVGFAGRADALERLARAGDTRWRPAAKELGTDLYRSIMRRSAVSRVISAAERLSTRKVPSVLQFAGPSELLRVPFELLASDNDFLCFQSIISRQIAIDDIPSAKTRPFHRLLAHLLETDQPLNILLIGINSDGRIDGVNAEVAEIKASIQRSLSGLGIAFSITTLTEAEATYENVSDRIASGKVHLLHFAGHGCFNEKLPEESGVVIDRSANILSSGALKALLSGGVVEMVFLSCCVGARTATMTRRGDFHGVLEAIARAGVPSVLGHRWDVPDGLARAFAVTFYEELMATLSPGLALLSARNAAAADRTVGRDNSMWACPVLVSLVEP